LPAAVCSASAFSEFACDDIASIVASSADCNAVRALFARA
jgi:hypothetical protein